MILGWSFPAPVPDIHPAPPPFKKRPVPESIQKAEGLDQDHRGSRTLGHMLRGLYIHVLVFARSGFIWTHHGSIFFSPVGVVVGRGVGQTSRKQSQTKKCDILNYHTVVNPKLSEIVIPFHRSQESTDWIDLDKIWEGEELPYFWILPVAFCEDQASFQHWRVGRLIGCIFQNPPPSENIWLFLFAAEGRKNKIYVCFLSWWMGPDHSAPPPTKEV